MQMNRLDIKANYRKVLILPWIGLFILPPAVVVPAVAAVALLLFLPLPPLPVFSFFLSK